MSLTTLTKKAVSLGTIGTLFLAGSVLLNGRTLRAAQAAQTSAKPAATSTAPVEAPLTEEELVKLLKHNKKHLDKVAAAVQTRGVDFEFTPQIEKKLKKAGAVPKLITYMQQFTPSARAAQKAHVGNATVSTAEAEAYNKLKNETNPDAIIADANTFAQKFPKSSLLTYIYALEAGAYQQKNDAVNVVKYGEMSLDLDSGNLISLLMVSSVLPQPQMLSNVTDAEKEKRLGAAATYAERALQEVNQLPKQPKETDAAYQKRRDSIASGAYASLGMIHLERSQMALEGLDQGELAKAELNFRTAIEKAGNPNPADYYRLGEVCADENKFDAAINAFTKAGQLAPGTIIQTLADQQVQRLKKA